MIRPNNSLLGNRAPSRRNLMIGSVAAASALAAVADAKDASRPAVPVSVGVRSVGTIRTQEDWGKGPPIVFSHGWPLNAGARHDQTMFMGSHGFRSIAFDRRGHGRSSRRTAADLSALIGALDPKGAASVGHSAGAGDIARYIGRYGKGRFSGTVLVSTIPPLMLKTPANRGGVPIAVFAVFEADQPSDVEVLVRARPGMTFSHKDKLNDDLLAFVKSMPTAESAR